MTILNKTKFITSLFLLLFITHFTFADFIIDNDFDFSLDIPEGYELSDVSEDAMTLMFTHPNIPVTFFIRIYDKSHEFKTSEDALKETLNKLSATYETSVFNWSNEECTLSPFKTNLNVQNGTVYSGWSVSAPLKDESNIVLICYAPEQEADKCQDFMISTINSLCIKSDYYNIPGIITTFAYPSEGKTDFTVKIANKNILSHLDKSDSTAAQFVIDMEYRILNYYGQHNLWMKAWQRYYRMIFRDSYGRLEDFSQKVLDSVYMAALKKRSDNPDIQFAQYILSWVQTFPYVRATEKSQSDFSNIPSVLQGAASDCDNRSLLVCILLEYADIDSMLLISPVFGHAMAATDIEAPGQTFINPENEREYIVGETTADVTWGMMAREQADKNKWFTVTFP